MRPQKHYFEWHFRASKIALTKTRLLKHDFPVHGKGCRVGPGKTAGETAETPEKQSKQLFFGCFGCFSSCFSAVLPGPTRHPFRLFFGCPGIWHTSVDGRRDCNPSRAPLGAPKNTPLSRALGEHFRESPVLGSQHRDFPEEL